MRWFPLALTLWFGLSACSLLPERTSGDADGPERAEIPSERIHTVGDEPPPVAEPSLPRSAPTGAVDELQPLAGNDPRRGFRTDAGSEPARQRAAAVPAYRPPPKPEGPQAPMAGRVGVMSLIGNELRHVHAGTTSFGNHDQSYDVQYDFGGYVAEELRKALLTRTPYQPVPVGATGLLRRDARTWMDTWDGKRFAEQYQREFDGIIEQNRLAMLIIVAYPTIDDGVLGSRQKLHGSGLYTKTFLGSTKAAVFSTLQFYRLVGHPAQLVQPVSAANDRNIGDLPNANLPEELKNLPARYLAPVYQPLRQIVQNKIDGLVSLPRKLGH